MSLEAIDSNAEHATSVAVKRAVECFFFAVEIVS